MFDRQHIHVVWGGTLPGNEIWSNSLRMATAQMGDNIPNPLTWQELEDWLHGKLKTDIQNWHTSSGSHIHMGAVLTYAKANYIKTDGHYLDVNTHEHVYNPPPVGNYSGNQPPNQVSLAISLVTGLQRGYAHRGRFYSPLPSFTVQPDGRISQGNADEVAAAASVFLTALNDQPGWDVGPKDHKVLVMSSRGAGASNPVSGVEVGRVLDTQRRRRQELVETYSAASVSA
jgi:hypothetical protein